MRLYAPQWKYEMLHYTTPSRDTAAVHPWEDPQGLFAFTPKKRTQLEVIEN